MVSLLSQTYARELARLLDVSLNAVQLALRSLEQDGVIAARAMGRTRMYALDGRYFARDELERYLRRLVEAEHDLKRRVDAIRRRPRRTGKPT